MLAGLRSIGLSGVDMQLGLIEKLVKLVGGEEEISGGGEVEVEKEMLKFFEFNGIGDKG